MRSRWLQGFALGVLTGAILDLLGPVAIAPAAVLVWLVLRGSRRLAAGSGAAVGTGLGVLVLLLPSAFSCAADAACAQPTLSSWIGLAVGFLILGVGLGLAAAPSLAFRGLRDDPLPGTGTRALSHDEPSPPD
ncbi:MAG: hypothetical protein ABIV26_00800 [Candidatus Limnocylindrales bacterium]